MNISTSKIVIRSIVALIGLALLISALGTVAESEVGVKTRLGKVVGLVDPGLYVKIPFVDKVNIIETNTRTINYDRNGHEGDAIDSSELSAASKDQQDVWIGVTVNYRADRSKADKIFVQYKTVRNYEASVAENIVRDSVKTVSARYTAAELLTSRAEFNSEVSKLIAENFSGSEAILERVNITNIRFSEAFTKAIEAKVTAVQNAEAAKNKLEQVKFEAQQKIETAKAEAESIRIQAQAVTSQGGADYVKLKWIEKWTGIVPQTTLGGQDFMVNLK